jgi:hypothetical protein
MLALTKEKP